MLAWMDLEMTGLEPDRDVIVEIATLVTDDDLEIVAEGPDLVIHQPAEALADDGRRRARHAHPQRAARRRSRHRRSRSRRPGPQTLAFLKEHMPEPRTVPLCGNSHRHRPPVPRRLPPRDRGYLHYRSIDVSTLKELARRWYPETLRGGAREGAQPPRPRRHPRERRRAALLPRRGVRCRRVEALRSTA